MVNRPSVPEIITVNSEELQTLIRDLLPSQNGFGSELQATNVITPIIDLTATAEGSNLRSDLQTALAFGSQTEFLSSNSTVVLANSPGFYRIIGSVGIGVGTGVTSRGQFEMTDGATTKIVWSQQVGGSGGNVATAVPFDFNVWLATGESISAVSLSGGTVRGSIRQIADSEGTLVPPSGYPL